MDRARRKGASGSGGNFASDLTPEGTDQRGRMIQNEPAITPELIAEHGLKPEEYERILKLLGRAPSFTELGIFSAM